MYGREEGEGGVVVVGEKPTETASFLDFLFSCSEHKSPILTAEFHFYGIHFKSVAMIKEAWFPESVAV